MNDDWWLWSLLGLALLAAGALGYVLHGVISTTMELKNFLPWKKEKRDE